MADDPQALHQRNPETSPRIFHDSPLLDLDLIDASLACLVHLRSVHRGCTEAGQSGVNAGESSRQSGVKSKKRKRVALKGKMSVLEAL